MHSSFVNAFQEKERECGMLSWEDLATLSKKNAVAEKYELGPHQSRKKSRTQKIDGGGAQMSAGIHIVMQKHV